jgi:hypothetical protein
MAKYYEVTVARSGKDGKTNWRRIGTAFDAKNGEGMNVELDALPLSDSEGKCRFIIRPPLEKTDQPQKSQNSAPLNQQLNDDIPWLA